MISSTQNWPVDGHVHFHLEARVGSTLDAAACNFRAASGRRDGLLGALLLTQGADERVFESLRDTPAADGWTIHRVSAEPETLIARSAGAALAIVCGRQVRAVDGLEVLALGTVERFPDGRSFAETIDTVRQSGALTVLPWGFGKWLGQRGERVEAVLEANGPDRLFIGDNGSRLRQAGTPTLLRSFAQRGFRVLPGGDPFPFGQDQRRVGRFGFLADYDPSESAPWRELRAWLQGRRESPRAYGEASGPVRFVANQVGIQIYNRFLRGRAS